MRDEGARRKEVISALGPHPSPLTMAWYANRQSGQVESLVIDCGFDSHLG